MNKKIVLGIGLSVILTIVVFLNYDRKSKEDKILDAISWFIYEQTGEFEDYKALEFIEITNEMLLQDVVLKKQLTVLKDTLNRKVTLLDSYQKLPKSWHKELSHFHQVNPDQVDDWLKINAKLDLALSTIEKDHRVKDIQEMGEHAIAVIEAKLMGLNLSMYSINLSGEESIHFLHRFALDGEEQLSVFEIDKASQQVISYKQIG